MEFGTHLTSFDVMAFVTRNADNLLIGWFSGPRPLSFYDKAYQMLLVPTLQFSTPLGVSRVPVHRCQLGGATPARRQVG